MLHDFSISHSAPPQVVRISHHVAEHLSKLRSDKSGFPRLVSVDEDSNLYDWCNIDLHLALAPGLIMLSSIERDIFESVYGSNEALLAASVAVDAIGAVVHSEILQRNGDAVRKSANMLVAEWQRYGVPARLLHLNVTSYDEWAEPEDADWHVIIEGLGDNLRAAPIHGRVRDQNKSKFDAEFGPDLRKQLERLERRAELKTLDADGWIDELSVRILQRARLLKQGLSAAMRTESFATRLTRDTALIWEDGYLRSAGRRRSGIEWSGATLILANQQLPETLAVSCIGRPVTDLIDYAPLTQTMTISSIGDGFDDDGTDLHVELNLRQYLFNSASCRVWLPAD